LATRPAWSETSETLALWQLAPEKREVILKNPGYDRRLLDPKGFLSEYLERSGRIFQNHVPVPRAQRLAFNPDGNLLLISWNIWWESLPHVVPKSGAGPGPEILELWDLPERKRLAIWSAGDEFSCFQFSPDGKRAAVGGHELTIWDVATGSLERTLTTGKVDQLAFSPDSKRVLGVADGQKASLFDVQTGKELRTWQTDQGGWNSFALSPNGSWIASGGADRLIQLWDIDTGRELARWEAHDSSVTALIFSPDGKTLFSGGSDGALKLWNLPYIRKELAVLGLDW
jgi:WD40 repeat protein